MMGLDRHVNKWYLGQRPHLEGLGCGEIGSVWDKMGLGGHAQGLLLLAVENLVSANECGSLTPLSH